MPASLTRTCTTCREVLPIALFRDQGDPQRGRPPRACRDCRAKDPALQAKQARNVADRADNISRHRAWAARSTVEVIAAIISTYPDGIKRCPPYSGCGAYLPIEEFTSDPYQTDGLGTACSKCQAEQAALRTEVTA